MVKPSASSLSGLHELPASFSGASSPLVPKPRSGKRALTLIFGSLVVIGAGVATHVGANLGYDDSRAAYELSVAEAEQTQNALSGEIAVITRTVANAERALAADDGLLASADGADALSRAALLAAEVLGEHAGLARHSFPKPDPKPDWPWELFSTMKQLDDESEEAAVMDKAFAAASDDLQAADDDVAEAAFVHVSGAATASSAFEAAHLSARNKDIIDLRRAAEELAGRTSFDDHALEGYIALEDAAAAMIASEAAEIAEKQGPLYDTRLEVEAFARSLAPGVLLDFDWSPIVNGYGYSDSMAGYATWWYGDPGHANIELTDSVAAYWPGERSKSLVAHEVGHAISVKCQGMYDDSNQNTIEHWATAWAISMGFHSAANGTSAYGPPPQDLIDAASGCR
ncbi:hypothetical protein [Microbacterium sp. GXF6406]